MPVHLEYMPDFDLLISYSYGSVSMDEILSSIDTIYQNKVYKDARYCIIYVDTKEYLYEIKDSEVVVEKMMKYSKTTKREKDAFISKDPHNTATAFFYEHKYSSQVENVKTEIFSTVRGALEFLGLYGEYFTINHKIESTLKDLRTQTKHN